MPTSNGANAFQFKEGSLNNLKDPPQELATEILMGEEHRHVLAKLKFVLELIDALITMAEDKTNPIAMLMETRKSVFFLILILFFSVIQLIRMQRVAQNNL